MQLVLNEFFNVGSDGLPGVVSVTKTMNVEAYKLNLKGRFLLRKKTVDSCRQALDFFTKSSALDPNFAAAVHGIAETHIALAKLGASTISDSFPIAKESARRALDLDQSFADAYVTLGYCLEFFEFDRAAAERAYRRALRVDQSNSAAYLRLGGVLVAQRRTSEGVNFLYEANSLDPMWEETGVGLGRGLRYAGKFRDSVRILRSCLKFEPRSIEAVLELCATYALMGKPESAIKFLRRFSERERHPDARLRLAHLLAESGDTDEAREIVDSITGTAALKTVSQYELALALLSVGESGAAFEALEKEIDNHGRNAHFYAIDPALDSVRGDLRFRNLLLRTELLDI